MKTEDMELEAMQAEIAWFIEYVNEANSYYLIIDEPLHTCQLRYTFEKSGLTGIMELSNDIQELRTSLRVYVNTTNKGVNVGGLKQDPNYTKLKEKYKEIEQLAADVGTYSHGLKPNEAKASGLKAELAQAHIKMNEVIADIASLTAFKDGFKKRLTNIAKELEEEKNKKADEAFRARVKSEILANPDLLIDLILEEKKKDKTTKCIAKGGVLLKNDKSASNLKKFENIRSALSKNLTQLEPILEHVKFLANSGTGGYGKIMHDGRTYDSVQFIKHFMKVNEDLMKPILLMGLGEYNNNDIKFAMAKNRLANIDRTSKVNRKVERGTLKGRRLKIELSQEAYDTLKSKAHEFFEARSYYNDNDNNWHKPNDTAAILKIIIDAQFRTSGYDISSEDLLSFQLAADSFNDSLKKFNTQLSSKASKEIREEFEPKEVFAALLKLATELKKLNIK
ncbi:hypothetical protein L1887_49561 [Cichorium endivia]|nr:hypothetical protein L1887_49561 [Cichorium endivia]